MTYIILRTLSEKDIINGFLINLETNQNRPVFNGT